MADKIIRIGTRDSELALWQAHGREKLNDLGYKTEIVAVKAQGILFLTNLFMNSESLEFFTKHWILP
jgi:hydroxymethylbilane synthase